MVSLFKVENLNVSINNKKILDEISFDLKDSEICVLLGPNGSGKSTICNSILKNPKYEINSGKFIFQGKDVSKLDSNELSKKGIFMSFQHPVEISGVTMLNFLRTAYNSLKDVNINVSDFIKILNEKMDELGLDSKFRSRFVNVGFSGGEKKKSEILQLLLFEPKLAILDEIDSGLDVDSMKLIADIIKRLKKENNTSFLIVSHYSKFLDYLEPDKVIILKNGKVNKIGGKELSKEFSEKGFKDI